MGAHALGPHGDALAAPAVAGHHHGLARHHQIGGVHNGVPGRLAGTVFVVVVVLGLGVVHRHHGAGQDARLLPGDKAVDAGCGLLTAADEPLAQIGTAPAQQRDEVTAVVHDEVGTALQGLYQQVLVLLGGNAVNAVGIHTQVGHGGGHIVLGRQGITAGEMHIGSALPQNQPQVGGLGLQMDRYGDSQSGKGLFLAETLLNAAEGRHKIPHPLDLLQARGGQGHIFYNTHSFLALFYKFKRGQSRPHSHLFYHIPLFRKSTTFYSPLPRENVYTFVMDFSIENGYNALWTFLPPLRQFY